MQGAGVLRKQALTSCPVGCVAGSTLTASRARAQPNGEGRVARCVCLGCEGDAASHSAAPRKCCAVMTCPS